MKQPPAAVLNEWLEQLRLDRQKDIEAYLAETGQKALRLPEYVDVRTAIFYQPPRPGGTGDYTPITYDGGPNGLATAIRKRWLMAPPPAAVGLKPLVAVADKGAPGGRGTRGAESSAPTPASSPVPTPPTPTLPK